MRLACVKHAASVRSEPGSNSQVHLNHWTFAQQHQRTRPPNLSKHHHPTRSDNQISSACVNISRYTNNTPQTKRSAKGSQNPKPNIPFHQAFALLQKLLGAPPTYPFHSRYNFQRTIRYFLATFRKRPGSSGGRVLLAHEDDVNAGGTTRFPTRDRREPRLSAGL